MFGNQRQRLLRTKWANAQLLAEELFAMMDDESAVSSGPIDMQKQGDLPAFNITGAGEGDTIFKINKAGQAPVEIQLKNGQLSNPATAPSTGTSGSAAPTAFMGRVVSGSGSAYRVALIGGSTVTVTQLQIAADSPAIPAGTAVVVIKSGRTFLMQVPVWL